MAPSGTSVKRWQNGEGGPARSQEGLDSVLCQGKTSSDGVEGREMGGRAGAREVQGTILCTCVPLRQLEDWLFMAGRGGGLRGGGGKQVQTCR